MSMSVRGPGGWIPLPEPLRSREGNLEPFDWFRARREESAVRWDPDRGCWDVFTYDVAERVLTDPDTFASEPIVRQNPVFKDTLLALDLPEHTEKRSLVEDHFSPGAVQAYADKIEADAERLIDDAFAATAGTVDVVSALAYPLPFATIATLLGAPDDIRRELKALSDELIAGPQLSGTEDPTEFAQDQAQSVFDVGQFVSDLVVKKRADPGEDLVSILVTTTDLSHYELLRLCGLLLIAGHVTTTNLIANTVWCLARRPDALAAVRDAARNGDDATIERAVEEVLRFRSPAQLAVRSATEDVTVAGREIGTGEPIVVWLGAANRDPAVFDDPGTFDPTRDPNPNMAFGRGPHTCLGLHLAKLEARIVTRALFERVGSLDLVEATYEPVEAPFLHGVQELPVQYERAVDAPRS